MVYDVVGRYYLFQYTNKHVSPPYQNRQESEAIHVKLAHFLIASKLQHKIDSMSNVFALYMRKSAGSIAFLILHAYNACAHWQYVMCATVAVESTLSKSIVVYHVERTWVIESMDLCGMSTALTFYIWIKWLRKKNIGVFQTHTHTRARHTLSLKSKVFHKEHITLYVQMYIFVAYDRCHVCLMVRFFKKLNRCGVANHFLFAPEHKSKTIFESS